MYQLIPENLFQTLLKRLFVFLFLFIAVMTIVYQHQSINNYPSFKAQQELNKTDLIFTALN